MYFRTTRGRFDYSEIYRFWDYVLNADAVEKAEKLLKKLHGQDLPTGEEASSNLRISQSDYIDKLIRELSTKPKKVLEIISSPVVEKTQEERDRQLAKMKKFKKDLGMK